MFGSGIGFYLDGQVALVRDLGPSARTEDIVPWRSRVPTRFWADTHVNIYFVGDVETDIPNGSIDFAITQDPGQAGTWFNPFIAINDCGFGRVSGIDPLHTPDRNRTLGLILHEMTHYLARFTARYIGAHNGQTNFRCYNSEEHLYCGSTDNILIPYNPSILKLPRTIPGTYDDDPSDNEKAELWQRAQNNGWTMP